MEVLLILVMKQSLVYPSALGLRLQRSGVRAVKHSQMRERGGAKRMVAPTAAAALVALATAGVAAMATAGGVAMAAAGGAPLDGAISPANLHRRLSPPTLRVLEAV